MPRGKKIKIEITEKQRQTLSMWAAAGRTEQRYVQRAKVILFSGDGYTLCQAPS